MSPKNTNVDHAESNNKEDNKVDDEKVKKKVVGRKKKSDFQQSDVLKLSDEDKHSLNKGKKRISLKKGGIINKHCLLYSLHWQKEKNIFQHLVNWKRSQSHLSS